MHEIFPGGGEYCDKTFVSTSLDPKKAFDGNVVITIEAVNPHARINDISVYSSIDDEVLVRPNTWFQVLKKEKGDDGKWRIYVKEML